MIKEEFMCPELLHARRYASKDFSINHYPERTAEYFEICMYTESTGTVYINETAHAIKKYDVRFSRPGDKIRSDVPFESMSLLVRFGEYNTEYNRNFIDRIPSFSHTDEDTLMMFQAIIKHYSSMRTGNKVLMNATLFNLLHHLYALGSKERIIPRAVEDSIAYMKANYNQKITLETLGELTGYAPLHVLRLFKEHIGQSPCEYLQNLRMIKARDLLDTSSLTVYEITNAVGFSSHSSFQTLFQKTYGLTPGKYRKRSEVLLP